MKVRYIINLACVVLAVSVGVVTVCLGVRKGQADMLYGGIFVTVVMCSFAGYVFGVSDERKEKNRLGYIAWVRGPTRGARVFRGFVTFVAVCTALHLVLQAVKLGGLFR